MFKKIIDKFKRTFNHDIILLVGIILLSIITRLYNIRDKELWYDEVLDMAQLKRPVLQILKEVTITPLHYLIVHIFSFISTDVLILRLPSVIFGVLSVIVLYFTIKKIATTRIALLTAFLLA